MIIRYVLSHMAGSWGITGSVLKRRMRIRDFSPYLEKLVLDAVHCELVSEPGTKWIYY